MNDRCSSRADLMLARAARGHRRQRPAHRTDYYAFRRANGERTPLQLFGVHADMNKYEALHTAVITAA
jgi:hypothetical protein